MKVTVEITREQLIRALRRAGLKLPEGGESVELRVDNGGQFDDRNAAEVGPDGPLRVSWDVPVDLGEVQ